MEHSFYLKINNKQGLIARIALLLERRGYSINHLNINSGNGDLAEMELKVVGSLSKKEQIKEQLKKLVDVIDVKENAKPNTVLNLFSEKIILSYN
jgi:acetolactate synthase small subunit